MNARSRSYVVAIALVLAAAVVRLVFLQALEMRATYVTFFPAVILAALYGGLGPSLLATALSALLADYFWIVPAGQLSIRDAGDWLSIAIFLLNGAAIAWLTEAMHRARSRAAKAEVQAQVAVEREQGAEALRQSEIKYHSLFVHMTEGFAYCQMLYDEQGRPHDFIYLDVNDAFGRLTGLENVIGRRATDVIPGIRQAHPELFDLYSRVARSGIPERYELLFRPLDRWFSLSIYSPAKDYFVAVFENITERKRTQQELDSTARKYAAMFATTSDGVWIHNLQGEILEVNDAYCCMSGYSRDELTGMPISTLEASESREEITWHTRKLLERGGHDRFETRHRRKDGTIFDVDITALHLNIDEGRIAIFVRDITERKQTEQRLQAAREQLRLVTDTMSAPVTRCSRDLHYVWVSRPYAAWLGRPAEEIAGRPIAEILGDEALRAIRPYIERVLSGERAEYEQAVNFKGLGVRWVNAIYMPTFGATGVPDGWVAVVTDVTRRKELEQALRDEARKKDEFLAMLAHELRNPLAPIRNAVHILRLFGPAEPRMERARDMIDRQVTHMVRLIDDLLDISRITRGRISLRKERVDLTAMVEQACETVRPLIAQKRHTLTVSCAPGPIQIEADPARLVQVISNLLNNAAKFTEPGGSITISTERSAGEAIMRVRDTGMGITPEVLPRIFDLFVQGEVSLDRTEGGLGIGLTLVKHVVERHGGSVEARSAGRGCGSEFIVTWPALSSVMLIAAHVGATAANESGRHLRILLVEDSLEVAESFVVLLEIQGHEVRAAQTGPTALDVAATFVPDVAFIDLGLPGLDGYEVARRLRAMPSFQATVLVALTGYGQEEDKRRAQAAGFDHHLTKPVDPSTVDRLLMDIGVRFGERSLLQ